MDFSQWEREFLKTLISMNLKNLGLGEGVAIEGAQAVLSPTILSLGGGPGRPFIDPPRGLNTNTKPHQCFCTALGSQHSLIYWECLYKYVKNLPDKLHGFRVMILTPTAFPPATSGLSLGPWRGVTCSLPSGKLTGALSPWAFP